MNVLLRVHAKCVYGQDEVARQRIEAALALTASVEDPDVVSEPDVAETSGRIPGEQPYTAGFSRFQPVTMRVPPDLRFRSQGHSQHVVAGEGFEPSKLSRWIYSPKAADL